jgi:hypothetical protein
MKLPQKPQKVTDMLKATEDTFWHVYFSNKEVMPDIYAPENTFLIWDSYYIVNYETLQKYNKYIEQLEKDCKLLTLLR